MEKRDQASGRVRLGRATICPPRGVDSNATINKRVTLFFALPPKRFIVLGTLGVALSFFPAFTPQARASTPAYDNSCNDSITAGSGASSGTGFGNWSVSTGGGGGNYVGNSTLHGNGSATPGINNICNSKAWGLYANGTTVNANYSFANRLFTAGSTPNVALQPGQVFTIDYDNGNVASGGHEGFALLNATGQTNFYLEYVGSSSSNAYQINGSYLPYPNVGFTADGMRVAIKLSSASTYSVIITAPTNGTPSSAYMGSLLSPSGGQAITQVQLYDNGGGSGTAFDTFFNNMGITCPDALTFTEQPASEAVPTNDVAIFTVVNLGDSVTYQWQSSASSNGAYTAINGATNSYSITATNYESSYAVAATTANNGTWYRCVATDACGNTATSGGAQLTLSSTTAPVITMQPANTTVCSNSPATFTVTASGTSPGYAWLQSSNLGWGAGNAWSVTASNSSGSGVYLGSSTGNDNGQADCTGLAGNGDINSPNSGNALGMYDGIKVLRVFPSTLSAGQWFSIDMDNGNIDTGAQNGFSLHTGLPNTNGVLLSFYFLGGQQDYKIFDATGEHDTGIRFTRTGLRVQVLVGSAVGGTNTYSLVVVTNQCGASSNITNVFSGAFETNGPPGAMLLYNNNAGGGGANDLFFNNLIAGGAYDSADNYSVRNWANGGNGGDLPISGATSASYTINNAQSNNVVYYVIVTNTAGAVVSSTAIGTINALPTQYGVGGGGAYCSGGSGVSVMLSNSASGVTYYLQLGGNNTGMTLAGTGNSLSFINVTAAGSYTILASNTTTGCIQSMSGSATVTINALPTFTTSQANETCNGGANGSTTVMASGGSGSGYTYSTNNGSSFQASNVFSGLAAGTYTIVVEDSNGCLSTSLPVTITQPAVVTFMTSQTNVSCYGGMTGSITVTASGGNGGYQYSDNNGSSYQSGNTFSSLAAGLYTIMVEDSNGCVSGSSPVTITQPSALSCSVTPPSATICAGGSQTFTANPSGGTPGYLYLWSDGSTGTSLTTNAAGTYSVTVTDANGCTTTCSATLTVNTIPSITCPSNIIVSAAPGQCTSNITFSVSTTGTPMPTVVYSIGPTVITSPYAFTVGTTSVTCTASNSCGTASCSFSVTVTNSGPLPIVYVDGNYTNLAVGTSVNWPYRVGPLNHVVGCDAFGTIQAGLNAVADGTVNVAPGTYNESPNITQSVTLTSIGGTNAANTIIVLPTNSPNQWSALQIGASSVTVEGFTLVGYDGDPNNPVWQGTASVNILVDTSSAGITNIVIANNVIEVGAIDLDYYTFSDGFGIENNFPNIPSGPGPSGEWLPGTSPVVPLADLNVYNNTFEPVDVSPAYDTPGNAFFINPAGNFTFTNNTITGDLEQSTTSATNSLIAYNVVIGTATNDSSGAFATFGWPDVGDYGHATFQDNVITNIASAITVYDSENVTIKNNLIDGNGVGVSVQDSGFDAVYNAGTTVQVLDNSLANDAVGVENLSTNSMPNAVSNWWGNISGPSSATLNPYGTGSPIVASYDVVTFVPWLGNGANSITNGFVPQTPIAEYPPVQLVFTTEPMGGELGSPLSVQPVVSVEDTYSNVTAWANPGVTVAIGTNPGVGVLTGTLTETAMVGVATFTDLAITVDGGTGYTLVASASSLTSATSSSFNITNPAPTITSLSPVYAPAGSTNFTLTVSGPNFLPNSVVYWNGMALVTVYVSPTELTATVPNADLASNSVAQVTVGNPGPGGGTTTANDFFVEAPIPPVVYVDANYTNLPINTLVNWPYTGPGTNIIGYNAFATMQGGVNAVASNGTVRVAAGYYPELVIVSNPMTVLGANAGVDPRLNCSAGPARGPESIIDGDGTDAAIAFESSGVTLDGFTIQGGENDLNAGVWIGSSFDNNRVVNNIITNNAIGVWSDSAGPLPTVIATNLFVANNLPGSEGGSGLALDTGLNLQIIENEFTGHTNNNPVLITGYPSGNITNLLFTGNNVHDNACGCSAVYVIGIVDSTFTSNQISAVGSGTGLRFGDGDSGIDVENNLFTNCTVGVRLIDDGYLVDDEFSPPYSTNNDIVIHGNSFVDMANFAVSFESGGDADPVLDASANWWGDNTPAGVAAMIDTSGGPVDYTPWLDAGVNTASNACDGFQGDFSALHVSAASPQAGSTGRIQEGINLVADGSLTNGNRLLYVEPGTYSEINNLAYAGLLVNKPLTMRSTSGAASTIISNGMQYMVEIDASNVTMDSFTVTDPTYSTGGFGGDGTAIYVDPWPPSDLVNVHIENCVVHDLGDRYVGVYSDSGPGLEINGCTFYNIYGYTLPQYVEDYNDLAFGILVADYGPPDATVSIHDNDIHDIFPRAYSAGIDLGNNVASANVSQNQITLDSACTAGILLESDVVGPASINSNTVTGAQNGLMLLSPFAQTATWNNISGASVSIYVLNSAATIKNNSASAGSGIGIWASTNAAALIENNDLTGDSEAGIKVDGGAIVDAGDCSGSDVTGLGTGSGLNGSSDGGNSLSGYGFDNAVPWAVEDLNSNTQPVVLAQLDSYGAGVGQNINELLYDGTDNPSLSVVIFSQSGALDVSCPPATNVQCLANVPSGATTLAQFLAQGGVVSCSSGTVSSSDVVTPGAYPGDETITRTYTVATTCGQTNTCMQLITVNDTVAPMINTCASSQTISANDSCQLPLPDLRSEVAATDSCGGPVNVTQSPAPGTLVGLGPNTVTLYVDDGRGNTNSCTATITVVDTTPPSINSCASNRTISAESGCQAALPDLRGEVVASDNCGGPLNFIQTPTPGTLVGLGPNTVTLYVDDGRGNTNQCSATVTVSDTTPPTVVCTNITRTLNSNDTSVVVAPADVFNAVASSAICSTVTPVSVNPNTFVCGGTYTVTLLAADNYGNTNSCNATVTIVDSRPAPSQVYVDVAYTNVAIGTAVGWPYTNATPNHLVGCDAFATIQGGVNRVANNGTVYVAAGYYPELVIVSNPMTLLGANAGVDPRVNCSTGPARGPESIIDGLRTDAAIVFESSGVTLDGFTIQGGGSGSFNAGVHMGGGFENNQVVNNIITNNAIGVFPDCVGPLPSVIATNLFVGNNLCPDCPAGGAGVYVDSSVNLQMIDNEFTGHTNNNAVLIAASGADSHTNLLFTGNNVHDNNAGSAVYVLGVTTGTFTSNQISAVGQFTGIRFGDADSGIDVENNLFSNCTVGVRLIDDGYGFPINDSVVIHGNSFVDMANFAVSFESGGDADPVLDASANWWGTNTQAGVAAMIDTSGGPVDYTPWLDAGTDTSSNGCNGFQGDFSTLDVSATSPQAGLTGRIQEAIDLLADGALVGGNRVVNVLAGAYVEGASGTYILDDVGVNAMLYVWKPLQLLGPNANVNPNTQARVPEATVYPATNDPAPSDPEEAEVVYVSTNNVTINGLTVDGDNPALTNGVPVGGADVNAAEGIVSYDGVGSITVVNNIVTNTAYSGIDFYNYLTGGAATTDNRIQYNQFANIGYIPYGFGVGVLLYNNFYADVSDNGMSGVRLGVQTGNFSVANPGTTQYINNNTIVCTVLGVFHNLAYDGASAFTISNNAISFLNEGGLPEWDGIEIASIQSSVGAVIVNNTITGSSSNEATIGYPTVGYNVWSCPTTVGITISGGTVSNANYGVWLNNWDGYESPGFSTALTVSNMNISGAAQAGVFVQDDPRSGNGSIIHAIVTGNTVIDASGLGVFVQGTNAAATFENNVASFTGNMVGIEVDTGKALIQNDNLAGNTVAAILVTNGAIVDAGDCSGSDVTGLGTGSGPNGSSDGGNNLSGYGFDNAAPWAVEDLNSSAQPVVLAQLDNYGAGVGQNINELLYDATDNPSLSAVIFSQSGTLDVSCPPATNVQCLVNVPAGATTLAQFLAQGGVVSCSSGTVSFSDSALEVGAYPNEGTITRTYTVTTGCGQTNTCMQIITIDDTVAPVISGCATNLTLSANGSCQASLPDLRSQVVATDNCGGPLNITQSPAPGTLINHGTNTVTLYVDDGRGNTNSCSATVTVVDTTPPTISSTPLNFQCASQVPAPVNTTGEAISTNGVAASDNCGTVTVTWLGDVTNSLGCANHFTILRSYKATDSSGNTNSCVQTITVYNTTPPTAICTNITVNLNSNGLAFVTAAQVDGGSYGNCGGPVTLAINMQSFGCGEIGPNPVVLTVTDSCGNTNSCTATVTVRDVMPPVISGLASSVTVDTDAGHCSASGVGLGTPSVHDNCHFFTITNDAPGSYPIGTNFVLWTATDGSSNSSIFTQAVIVVDNQPPVLTCPGNVTVTTLQDKDPYATGTATATDTCEAVTISYNDNDNDLTNCNATGELLRTWTATDSVGNTATCTQTVTVVSTNATEFTFVPPDITTNNDAGQCSAVVTYATPTAVEPVYFQGFENPNWVSGSGDSLDWNDSASHVSRLASGSNGLVAASGSAYAVIDSTVPAAGPNYSNSGAVTFLGGIFTPWVAGYRVAQDVYVNLSDPAISNATASSGYGWDLSTSAADASANYLRDFVFHAAAYDPTSGVYIAASNGSSDDAANRGPDLRGYADHVVLTHSGWYTFAWQFRNTNGVLAVDLSVLDTNRTVLFTQTLSNPSDLISNVAGDPYYTWFTFLALDQLPIDDTLYEANVPVSTSPASGTAFPVGTTNVVCTATDACGATITTNFTVTVNDTEAPVITCPANVLTNNSPGLCAATGVTLGTATATDNCQVASITNNAPASFPVGTNYVVWTATDIHGNSSSCTQQVVVVDTEPPTANCPANIVVGNDPGQCGAAVSFILPTNTDNCGVASTVATPASGNFFPVGTTPVTVVVTDIHGNTNSCSFSVTVNDTEEPTISCPADVTANADAGQCYASSVALGTPVTHDNCGVATITNNAPATFPVGTTAVLWTATDVHGNSSTCTQTVIVVDNQPPTISCPATVTVDTDAGHCYASGVALGTPVTHDNCGVANVVNNAPAQFPIGTNFVLWTVTDVHGNSNTCTQAVIVVDNQPPVLTCPGNVTVTTLQDKDPYATGTATATDTCEAVTISYNDNDNDLTNCNATGELLRTWTATDSVGNTATCTQTVTVVSTNATEFTFVPPDITTNNDAGQCSAVVTYATPTAVEPVYFQGFENPNWVSGSGDSLDWNDSASHVSRLASGSNGLVAASGSAYAVIDSTVPAAGPNYSNSGAVTFLGGIFTPWVAGYRVAQDVYVNLSDPAISNATASSGYGWDLSTSAADASANYLRDFVFHAAAYDPTSGVYIAASNGSSDDAANRGPDLRGYADHVVLTHSGWYTFAWQFRNTNGVLAVDLSVLDTNRTVLFTQTLSNPSDLISNVAGDPYYTWFTFLALDQLPIDDTLYEANVPVSTSPASGTAFPVGTTNVVCTATDACGATITTNFTVTVNDTEAPVITCPANVLTNNSPGLCAATGVTLGTATATDNCQVASITNNAPASFPVGTNYVVWTATDIHGNSSSCTQQVVVVDTEPPMISCTPLSFQCASQVPTPVNTNGVTAFDNCGTVTVTWLGDVTNSLGCGYFTILRSYKATDRASNTNGCVQTITVHSTTPPTAICTNITVDLDPIDGLVFITASQVDGGSYGNCGGPVTLAINRNDFGCGDIHTSPNHVVLTVTDSCGNTNSCTAAITVRDVTPPVISCPAAVTVNADEGQCYASGVALGTAEADDNCGVATLVNNAPAQFPVGTNLVVWTATDPSGNRGSCTQDVIVVDNQPPMISCTDVTVPVPMGMTCACDVSLGSPQVSDNCGIASVVSNAAGCYPVGTNSVVWTATDIHGNSNSCTQLVIVTQVAVNAGDFAITGIQAIGDDINLTWQTFGNSTNVIQLAIPTTDGSFTNVFTDIGSVYVPGSGVIITNWTDYAGATNFPSRYYRVHFELGAPCTP